MSVSKTFYDILTDAINDLAEHGYDSAERLKYWMDEIALAAKGSMPPEQAMDEALREAMASVYRRLVDKGGALRMHPGVTRFTIEKVRPQLRAELDRRILASAQLIKLNRRQAIEKTLQRFSGWATSIPVGGSAESKKAETKRDVRKRMAGVPLESG